MHTLSVSSLHAQTHREKEKNKKAIVCGYSNSSTLSITTCQLICQMFDPQYIFNIHVSIILLLFVCMWLVSSHAEETKSYDELLKLLKSI